MKIKFMFLNLPNIGEYINTINLHFPSLKFCPMKQKYMEKRIFSSILCILTTCGV